MKQDLPDELPPFSLEEAERELSKVADFAWDASARAGAQEFIVGNLLIALDRSGTIDGKEFIRKLQATSPQLGAPPRIAADLMLKNLYASLSSASPGGYVLH